MSSPWEQMTRDAGEACPGCVQGGRGPHCEECAAESEAAEAHELDKRVDQALGK